MLIQNATLLELNHSTKFEKKEEIKLVEYLPLCRHVLQNCIRPLLIDYFLIAGRMNQLGSRANHVMLKKALSDEFETQYMYVLGQ